VEQERWQVDERRLGFWGRVQLRASRHYDGATQEVGQLQSWNWKLAIKLSVLTSCSSRQLAVAFCLSYKIASATRPAAVYEFCHLSLLTLVGGSCDALFP
jgi:hypothetical protein